MKKTIVLLFVALFVFAASKEPISKAVQKTPIPQNERPNIQIIEADRSDAVPVISGGNKSTFIPVIYQDATIITFSNGISFDTRTLGKSNEPNISADLRTEYRDDEPGYYIVQFSGPVYEAQKDWLRSHAVTLEFYLPKYGFVCRIANRATVDMIRQNPSVNWVGVYQPAYKISSLFDRVESEHVVTILLFNDAELPSVLDQVRSITQRTDFAISDNGINQMLTGKVSKDKVNDLALIKGIYWIEPYIQPVTNNVDVQWIVQDGTSGVRSIWARDIRGQGEVTSSSDTGINTNHFMHRSGSAAITTWGDYPTHNALIAYKPGGSLSQVLFGEAGSSYHGTHTAGTITGDDTTHGSSTYDGVALKSKHYFLDIGGTWDTLRMFGDLNDLYILPYTGNAGGVSKLCSNSWGAPVTGAYTTNSYAVDQFMWFHPDFLLLFSNGNNGGPSMIVGAPATAKNCVSVGSTDNSLNYNRYAGYTSRGPSADGRYKPTICAPGGNLYPVYSAYTGTNTIGGMTGTSMACPAACGAAALVRQYLREGWYPYGKKVAGSAWTYISAAILKAILVNSADTNITNYATVPNNAVGWGRIDIDSSLYFNGENRKLLLADHTVGIQTGEQVDYHFSVPASASNLKITMVWTDYPGNPSVLIQLVNDLDLIVYAPNGDIYRGNQYSANQSLINPAGRDSINVEENARRHAPVSGDWLVRIEGRNVAIGPQPFALVISYTAATTTAGVVTTNKPVYRANDFYIDTVRVRVEDENLGAAGTRDTARVTLKSKYIETQVETLKCVELAESAHVFTANMPLLFHKPVHGDGKLSVCQGDTITVTYTDANPSYTVTTWAAVDAYYFVISNVHCEKTADAQSVNICWTTNEPGNGKVYYGTSPASLNLTATQDTPYVVNHKLKLTGLTQNTLYYYDVESKDFRGNAVKDNNHDAHYTFTTGKTAGTDVLVVVLNDNCGGEEFAHPEFLETALKNGGWTYNWWKTKENGIFTRTQLKNYKAVFFQVAQENYPVWTVAQKETMKLYHNGGARFAMTGHDAGWDPWRNSPSADTLFCKDYLHFRYIGDVTAVSWNTIYGMSGDPISGSYTAGIAYQPFRTGAAGDSILLSGTGAPGTGSYVWHGNATNDSCGIKWVSTNNMGSLGDGVWGGRNTRVVHNGFEITQIDTANPSSATRTDILNNVFIWLIGHDHPDVTVSTPVTGGTYTTSPIAIAWTATAYGGAAIDSTWIEYSPDGGSTWYILTSGTGISSPYNWNISSLSNNAKYRVRVTVSDAGVYPSMKGFAETGNFRINRPGGDLTGPVTIPNSVIMQINPKIVAGVPDSILTFTAVVSDSETGLNNISTARFYVAGFDSFNCGVQDGAWDEVLETVTGRIRLFYLPGAFQICSLYVRGRDNSAKALNWGVWYMRTFTLIDGGLGVEIDESGTVLPYSYALSVPLPNPSIGQVRIAFALPHPKKVSLNVYNSLGQLVKTLIDENRKPGLYDVIWDGLDNVNRKAAAGIYFYRLSTDEYTDTKKAVLLR